MGDQAVAEVPKLMTPEQVSKALGVTKNTLATWRCNRRYQLDFVKCGSRVMYKSEAVTKFIEEHSIETLGDDDD